MAKPAKVASKVDEEKARLQAEREAQANQQKEAIVATPITGTFVTPEVDTDDPVEAAKQDPRIGEQDVPLEEREDGRTAGIRHDQMEGVQSAEWLNDLDKEEKIAENIAGNPRLVREATGTPAGSVNLVSAAEYPEGSVPRKTEEEMNRGKESLARRMGKSTD